MEHDENTAYYVDEESIEPLLNKCESSDVKDRPTPIFEPFETSKQLTNPCVYNKDSSCQNCGSCGD